MGESLDSGKSISCFTVVHIDPTGEYDMVTYRGYKWVYLVLVFHHRGRFARVSFFFPFLFFSFVALRLSKRAYCSVEC